MTFRTAARRPTEATPATSLRWYVEACRRLVNELFDPYRPEQHYMRGPGPKWREKHSFAYTILRHGNSELARAVIRRR